ncbi:hypothetical protein [Mesorhizobium sp. SP-1A]|uniref:type IV toxin-antitoxin system AbiEi family antitoxin domain-containing protein n=1 Tax=Mesorhizobium sp. SP-1A TaxID=3077840 RepID=UPI0028F74CA9|nr:hypothetical protein [Mesorhizobium sp. SP-1A]
MSSAWTKEDFNGWMDRNGLTYVEACEVLNLSIDDVCHLMDGTKPVWAEDQERAERFEASRFVSDDIDMAAALAELSNTCKLCPQGVITGVSAAALRGWTTANTHVYFVALLPEYVGKPLPSNVVPVVTDNILDRVEVRKDVEGGWYRLADPVRTVVDAVRDDVSQDRFSVEELVREAIAEGVDRAELLDFAQKQGEQAVERLNFYLSQIN